MHVVQPMRGTAPDAEADPFRGRETILLVDDEESVQLVVRDMLERRGYRVLVAAHGAEALKVSSEFRDQIDLLITDVAMPHMNGIQVARCLALQRPFIKILYISGYPHTVVFEQERMLPNRWFLQKPFVPQTLARKIRDALDGHRPAALS